MTIEEIDKKILENNSVIEQIDEKLKSLIGNSDFKRMQNGTDNVETQNIKDVMETLRSYKNDLLEDNSRLEKMKLSCCELKKHQSKLTSKFYGY